MRPTADLIRLPPSWAIPICVALGGWALLGQAPEVEAQATQLTPVGAQQSTLSGCDDCSESVPLTSVFPSGISLGGSIYTEIHIGSNGYITFGHGNTGYHPSGIPGYTAGPIIAPQFDDLDPGKGGSIYYDQNTADGHVVVTWSGVAPYATPDDGGGHNTFQVVLRSAPDRDATDFDIEIRYVDLQWARSGNIGDWPTSGWSAGDQTTYVVLPHSGQSSFRSVQHESTVGSPGVYRWRVVGGVIQSLPSVSSTSSITSLTGTSAESGGKVSDDGGAEVTARGLVYHTSPSPTTSHASVDVTPGVGAFTATLSGLEPVTTYYVRAFATNVVGTAYGPERSFTTPRSEQSITFDAPAERTYGDAAFELSASASSSLAVDYASSDPEVATVTDGTVTITGAGTTVITASQDGNAVYYPADPVEHSLVVHPKPIQGTFEVPSEKVYDTYTLIEVTGRGLVGVEPSDDGEVELTGGTARFETRTVGEAKAVELEGAALSGSRAAHYVLTGFPEVRASIVPGPADHLTVAGPDAVVADRPSGPLTVTVRDSYGNATSVETPVIVALSVDREGATARFDPSDEELTLRAGASSAEFSYANRRVGIGSHRITVTHIDGSGLPAGTHGSHDIEVKAADVASFRIDVPDTDPGHNETAGEPVVVTITALDAYGNVATGFEGSVIVGSDGELVSGGGVTEAFESGTLSHEVRFAGTGDFGLTVEGPEGSVGTTLPVPVIQPAPKVSLGLEVDDWTPALGQTVNLEVTATNRGTTTAYGVEVRNPLHGQNRLEAQEVTPERGTMEPDGARWRVGTLAPGESVTLRIRARVAVPE